MVTCRWRRGLAPPWLASLLCCWLLWRGESHYSLWIRTLTGLRSSLGSTPQRSDDGYEAQGAPGDKLLLHTAQEEEEELKTERTIHHVDTNTTLHVAACLLSASMLATAANVVFSARSARQRNMRELWPTVCEDGVKQDERLSLQHVWFYIDVYIYQRQSRTFQRFSRRCFFVAFLIVDSPHPHSLILDFFCSF